MEELFKAVLVMPLANLLIVAGIVFLFVSVVGDISGKISPGKSGRIASGVIGVILLVVGFSIYNKTQEKMTSPEGDHSTKPSQAGNTSAPQSIAKELESVQPEQPQSPPIPPSQTPTTQATLTEPLQPILTASITVPQNGARVGLSVLVEGQVSGLNPSQQVFLCVKSQAFGKLVYPQGKLIPDSTGKFTIKSIYGTAGYSYETFVVSSNDAEAVAMLSDERYRKNGMHALPQNANVISPIVVVTRE